MTKQPFILELGYYGLAKDKKSYYGNSVQPISNVINQKLGFIKRKLVFQYKIFYASVPDNMDIRYLVLFDLNKKPMVWRKTDRSKVIKGDTLEISVITDIKYGN